MAVLLVEVLFAFVLVLVVLKWRSALRLQPVRSIPLAVSGRSS